jgi:hypothetical protein
MAERAVVQVTTYQRKQLFIGDDAQDVLGQPLLDSGRNDNLQGRQISKWATCIV